MTTPRSAATATPAASRAASARRSRPTSRTRTTRARASSSAARSTACSCATGGRPASSPRARGVGGEEVALTVEAPTVVLAAGSIETPAVLLRSGIGGPAVGKNLRLHPTSFVGGVYDEDVQPWRGSSRRSSRGTSPTRGSSSSRSTSACRSGRARCRSPTARRTRSGC